MLFRSVFLRRLLVALAVALSAAAAQAMSVIAPTFDQLVASAEFVVRGVVTDIKYVTVDTPQGQAIKTLVTLHVERTLKGNPGADVTLSLLGGRVGRRRLEVVGMPTFNLGDREIVFVRRNGEVICPLIGAGHGRYHVRHDASANRDYVARDNDTPLTSTDDVARSLESANGATPTPAEGLSPDTFETRIIAAVRNNDTPALP